jgi:hypothetical protein
MTQVVLVVRRGHRRPPGAFRRREAAANLRLQDTGRRGGGDPDDASAVGRSPEV